MNDFIRNANGRHNNKYDYSKVNYINNKTNVEIICPKHGSFQQRPDNHIYQGQGCPKCSNTVSSYENEIVEWIESNITINIIRNSRKIIKPYELDIYLPDYDIAIEFNGKYWHDLKKVGTYYHQMKFNRCRDIGIYLIHIFEEDYLKYKNYIFEEIRCCCDKKLNN